VKVEPIVPLDPSLYREIVHRALAEDLRSGDVTTDATIPIDQRAIGSLITNSPCTLAGVEVAVEAFMQRDPDADVSRLHADGDRCKSGDTVVRITGSASALLSAERTALNFFQRMSGTATLTQKFVEAVASQAIILDTRKTTPTLRILEKYAVRAGGGVNHRLALDDGVLIKDNHIQLVGSVAEALRRVRAVGGKMPLEVEAQSLKEVDEAVAAGADIVLVDNLSTDDVREAVKRVGERAKIEVSGGITLDRASELASTGVTYISVGALTHSAPAVDCSFDLCSESE
jgi:nicotinate-nucleotide pyrophosphorylase (carboxylating)